MWCNLRGAGNRNDFDICLALCKEASGDPRKDRRYAHAVPDVVERKNAAILSRRDGQPAAAELEIRELVQFPPRLLNQIVAGHARIGSAVGDKLRDVLGPDEEGLELTA